VVSPLLGPDVDEATRNRLVYTIGDRQAALVELSLSTSAPIGDIREQFSDVFHAAFAQQSEQPPEPVPISASYMRCLLTPDEVTKLADQDTGRPAATPALSRTIYRIWPDYVVRAHIDRSATTIKADAATRTYGTAGIGVVWAVIDSGIDKDHPHFAGGTLTDPAVAHLHRDLTGLLAASGTVSEDPSTALTDPVGHGTHVAGIIAGAAPMDQSKLLIAANQPTSGDLPSWVSRTLDPGRTLRAC
jgi:subtilisin family serine protease